MLTAAAAGAPARASATRVITVQPAAVPGGVWKSVSGGEDHTCAVKLDGTAWCWGSNRSGQLGGAANLGVTTPNPNPLQVGTATNWASVSVGLSFSCGLRTDGTLWCWGTNWAGQLGTSTNSGTNNATAVPVQVGAATDWTAVSTGHSSTCGVRSGGTLWCWGGNRYGQLGTSTNNDSDTPNPTPAQAGVGTVWTSVSTDGGHTCALTASATIWCWGQNASGELGRPRPEETSTQTAFPVPGQVGSATDWASVDTGNDHTCGLRTNGTAWCWGDNWSAELGNGADLGTSTPHPTPIQVGTDGGWTSISAANAFSCGVRSGTARCWGFNYNGQVGTATNAGSESPVTTPTQVGSAATWSALTAADGGFTCATRTDSTLWCWGNNYNGQLGNGSADREELNPAPGQVS